MRKKINQKEKEFIVVNGFAQVFSGLKGGYPKFSNNWDEAKPLHRIEQYQMVQRGTIDRLEVLYLD
jgi:hypothetical protein